MPKATTNSGSYYEEGFPSDGNSSSQSDSRQEMSGKQSGTSPRSHAHDAESHSDPVTSLPPSSASLTDGSTHGTSAVHHHRQTSSAGETAEDAQERDERADELLHEDAKGQEGVAAADEAEALRPDLEEQAEDKREAATPNVTKGTRRRR